jgi:ribosome-binding ATPase YchF (GTP1/OBG family)
MRGEEISMTQAHEKKNELLQEIKNELLEKDLTLLKKELEQLEKQVEDMLEDKSSEKLARTIEGFKAFYSQFENIITKYEAAQGEHDIVDKL